MRLINRTILVGVIAASPVLFSQLAHADEDRTISVAGTCIKQISPDRGSIRLVAQFTEKQANTAMNKALETYEKTREAIRKLGLKNLELQTVESNIQEQSDWVDNKRVHRGYLASMGLEIITSDIYRLGEVIQLTTRLPIQRVEQLRTFLSETTAKNAHESCLAEAVSNAQTKAQVMAKAANVKVGNALKIDELRNQDSIQPLMLQKSVMMDGAKESARLSPQVEAKLETIQVNVSVIFQIR